MQTISLTRDTAMLSLAVDELKLARRVIHEVALGSLEEKRFRSTIGYTYHDAVSLRDSLDQRLDQSAGAEVTLTVTGDDVAVISRCLKWALDDFAGDEFQIRVGYAREAAWQQLDEWEHLGADLSA
ncbi:MAG: hypothetical protein J2P24_04060 [Streptosporangiales bacterium]|nr:hypothetical protein [Streptosporangiales bacterium]MBO0889952.1 hypothetical protein [Acidothermales bacterium]